MPNDVSVWGVGTVSYIDDVVFAAYTQYVAKRMYVRSSAFQIRTTLLMCELCLLTNALEMCTQYAASTEDSMALNEMNDLNKK